MNTRFSSMLFSKQCSILYFKSSQNTAMSPKLPVSPLGFLCVKRVSNRLIQVLSNDEGLNYEAAREYLSDVTNEILQDILNNILCSINLDAATRFSCLKVLLRNDVKKLATGMFPHSYYEKILRIIIQKGKGLRHINLKGVWARDHPALLTEMVDSLNNLQVLIIPHMANDALLQCIAGCKYLNILDISGEAYFTADGLSCLKNENLQILDIGNYGKKEVCEGSSDDVKIISSTIKNLPNLKSIRIFSYTGHSILFMKNLDICSTTKLTYLHDTESTNEIFDAISELCPYLESIHIESPENGVISRFRNLKRLICLKLVRPPIQELTEYVSNFGSKLEILKIYHNKSQPFDLSNIATGASGVHTLEFYQMQLLLKNPNTFFMSLKNIEMLYCDISDSCLKRILTNSPLIERVIVGCAINFTDGDIFRLCAECDFHFLEELWFSCAKNLTILSVELLAGHCAKIRKIGQMSGWDVTNEELELFRNVIQVSNIDLDLLASTI